MKIAHVVDSMEMGGAETLVSQMSGLQREAGHNPCVYAIADLGTLGEKMRAEGFSVQSNVRPMIETFPLAKAADAYQHMMSGKARFRVVLIP